VTRLLDYLRGRGVLEDALVIVVSDHGECMWEHGEEFDHGRTVYQATMHALCVMRLPGGEAGGTRVKQLFSSIDVLPTILGVLGLDAPPDVDGESVDLRTLSNGMEPRVRFGEASKPHANVETDPRWTNIRKARCMRSGRHKYIWTPYAGTRELYDLSVDPDEVNDLLTKPDEDALDIASAMHERLLEWTNSADPLPSQFDPSQREESIRRLRSLGYIQ
jgi:arylsulfatase A-like enzyme